MKMKYLISFVLATVSTQLFAFPCYFTLAKDSCWANYDVKVVVIDNVAAKPLFTVEIPKGKSWVRQSFECHPAQSMMYEATFTPAFWKAEEGKTYFALRYWSLPGSINSSESAWEIPVCFPADFAAVPFPPDAQGNCQCDFNSLPKVQPQGQPPTQPAKTQ